MSERAAAEGERRRAAASGRAPRKPPAAPTHCRPCRRRGAGRAGGSGAPGARVGAAGPGGAARRRARSGAGAGHARSQAEEGGGARRATGRRRGHGRVWSWRKGAAQCWAGPGARDVQVGAARSGLGARREAGRSLVSGPDSPHFPAVPSGRQTTSAAMRPPEPPLVRTGLPRWGRVPRLAPRLAPASLPPVQSSRRAALLRSALDPAPPACHRVAAARLPPLLAAAARSLHQPSLSLALRRPPGRRQGVAQGRQQRGQAPRLLPAQGHRAPAGRPLAAGRWRLAATAALPHPALPRAPAPNDGRTMTT